MNGPLPHPQAEPLHIFPPGSLAVLLAVLAALVVAYLLWRLLRLPRRGPARPAARTPAPAADLDPPAFLDLVDEIERRARSTGRYRLGCHELAAALRRHFAERSRRPLSVWTAGDMRRHLGDQPVVRLFERVAESQFKRRLPDEKRFAELCRLARSLAEHELTFPERLAGRLRRLVRPRPAAGGEPGEPDRGSAGDEPGEADR